MNGYAIQLEFALAILAVGVLLTDAFRPVRDVRRLGLVLAGVVGVLFVYSFTLQPVDEPLFHGTYRLDALALFFKRLFLFAVAYVLLMSAEFVARIEGGQAEFYALMLLCATGMLVLASANDFLLMFVGLELVTISFFVLTSYLRRQVPSLEAGTKYLILGALSSGLTVYGIAYVMGIAGTANFDRLREVLAETPVGEATGLWLGMALVLAGLGFKIASVPFQVWAPDVYQGAPTPVTAMLAVGSKAAGFVLLLRVLLGGLLPMENIWGPVVLVLAAASLVYGNLGAIPQRDIKRLLGYSSIGHAGYVLMGIAAVNALGAAAVLFYLGQYAVTNLCAFLAIVAVTRVTGRDDIASFAGLHQRAPILGLALFLAMMSLAGVPPLSGFFGKFQLFAAVVERAQEDPRFYWLAAIGAAAVVVSLYFYLNVGRAIYLQPAENSQRIAVSWPVRTGLWVAMGAMVGLGLYQRPLVEAAQSAARVLGVN